MTTFADTSALYAYLDRADDNHPRAAAAFADLLDGAGLVTHNYVVVEIAALVQRRLGSRATRTLFDDVLPVVDVVFVDDDTNGAAITSYRAGLRRRTSLVDHVSFQGMHRTGLHEAFAFDDDFTRQGFTLVPSRSERASYRPVIQKRGRLWAPSPCRS